MLARLLFREETYSGPHQGLRSSRYIRTVKLLHDGRGVCPTIRTRLLRTNYVSKLDMAYERDLGVTHDWNDMLRTGIPVRSDLVTPYMAFVREEQKRLESKYHKHLLCFTATS